MTEAWPGPAPRSTPESTSVPEPTDAPGLTGPAPGWYHDDNGVIRWWNGAIWDVGAPPPAPPPPYPGPYPTTYASPYPGAYPGQMMAAPVENRSMAMLAHLGAFIGGFILPLIIMLTTGKTDPFVRYHATESLDFQLTYLTFVLGGMILSLATFGIGFILFFPLLIVVAIGHIAFAIQACIAANRGEWYRYPVCIRFVKHV